MTGPEHVTRRGTAGSTGAWQPGSYLRYAGERARPFVELVARIDADAPRTVVDLGCGEGSLTASLGQRWPGARITGVDSSPEMLAAAPAGSDRLTFSLGDVREWAPAEPADVVISNAVLHWVPEHPALLSRWATAAPPGGWLAVQVPGNFRAPTHALLAQLCTAPEWADRLAEAAPRPDTVLQPGEYAEVLTTAGLAADVWETTYLHVLSGPDPVLSWVRSTALRPVLARLDDAAAERFTDAYAAALRDAYPPRPDGTTVLPFRRIFVVGHRPPGAGGLSGG